MELIYLFMLFLVFFGSFLIVSLSPCRYSQLAGLLLRPGAQLERPAAASAHRHGEERRDPAGRGQPAGSEELPLLPPVHLTDLPPAALGGHTESAGAATQLRPGAAPAGGTGSPQWPPALLFDWTIYTLNSGATKIKAALALA